jgi:hypothetical protein
VAVKAATGAALLPEAAMFRPNSDVLPLLSVAVAVTMRPLALGGNVATKLPSGPAVVEERNVCPTP